MRNPIVSLTLLFACATAGFAFGQQIHLPPMVQQGPNTSSIPVRTQEEADRERAKKANEMLQMEIKRDTEKLVQLSAELKESVDKVQSGYLGGRYLQKG